MTAKQADMFYLTEPSRGIFVVCCRIGASFGRFEISRAQLANFLVDGAAMALRPDAESQPGAGGHPAPSAPALSNPAKESAGAS